MEEQKSGADSDSKAMDLRLVIREAIQEFTNYELQKAEPAYKAELLEERKRREMLEGRLNEVVEEAKRSKQLAEEAQRSSAIRSELQRLGVAKIDLAFRAVKDDVYRAVDGSLKAKGDHGEVEVKEYLADFVSQNPELLPARIAGGSGAGSGSRKPEQSAGIELEKIKPGMSEADIERVRQEIARIAAQGAKGF